MKSINQSGNIIVILLVTVKSLKMPWSTVKLDIINKTKTDIFSHKKTRNKLCSECYF